MAKKRAPIDPDDWLGLGTAAEPDDIVASASGIVVTKARLSVITGLAAATLDKAFAEGAPIIAKGNRKAGWQINTADFFGWYVRHKMDSITADPDRQSFDQAKASKTSAEARLAEMKLAKLEGETLTIDEAVALYREEASVIRSQLIAIPGRCGVIVAAEGDAGLCEAIIADEINLALSNITGDRPETWTGESEDDRDRREDAERDNDSSA